MITLLRFPLNAMVTKIFCYLAVLSCFFQGLEGTYINRFSDTFNGGISYTGNTVGLSKAPGQNNAGTADSIGAFTSVNTALQVGDFPNGTTLLTTDNSSAAVLDLPPNSEVVYAELVISGSYGWPSTAIPPPSPPAPNVSITITDPHSTVTTLACDPSTAQNALTPGFSDSGNYVRSVIVTNQVIAGGAGTYIVSQVPGTVAASDNSHNAAGWTLAVVYRNPNMNTNNINFWVGCEQGSQSFTPQEVSGFCTPSSGPISARLFISALEGDANITGDRLLFGSTPSLSYPQNALFGDNNPINNFFCSQINTLVTLSTDSDGKLSPVGSAQLDTRGTFGTRNQNPFTRTNISAGRQGQDITSIDISNKIVNGQSSAYVLGSTVSDDFTISSLAIQVQVGAPIIVANKLVNGQFSIDSVVGDTVRFSTTFINNGTSDADHLTFQDILPIGMSFVPGSVIINNVPNPLATPSNIPLGELAINDSVSVEFQATIDSVPSDTCFYTNTASLDYEFVQCSQLTPTVVTVETNPVTIYLDKIGAIIQATKNINMTTATTGDIVTYTISLSNLGDTDAELVTIQDMLPNGLDFVPGSVTIDGVPSADTPPLISVGELAADGSPVLVTFQAEVTAPPDGTSCTFSNLATVFYSYTDCSNATFSDSTTTNSIALLFELTGAQILATKTANPISLMLGDTLTFTISLTNQSLLPATEIFFQDLLPSGLTFQSGSVTIDAIPNTSANPNTGFTCPDIPAGTTTIIQFDAVATAFPLESCHYLNTGTVNYSIPCTLSPILSVTTNQVAIPAISRGASLTAVKDVFPSLVKVNDHVIFTINLSNIGDLPTFSVTLRDLLPIGLNFIPNSLTYNGIEMSASSINDVELPNLVPGESAVIQFQAAVNSAPQGGCLYNNLASIDYIYLSPCDTSFIAKTVQTNQAFFNVEKTSPIEVNKLVNSMHSIETSLGDTVIFSVDVKNKGNNFIRSLVFKDILEPGLSFESGSFSINGVLQPDPNFTIGVSLGRLAIDETVHLEFKAKITKIPASGRLNNYATFDYVFVDPCSGTVFSDTTATNSVSVLFQHPDPSYFYGKIKKCKYLNRTEYTLTAHWTAPSPNVLFYRIYSDGKVIATISANDRLVYRKCFHSKKEAYKLKLVAVYANHLESRPIKLRITHE